MADVIGPHAEWSPYIRGIFWTKDISYHSRFRIVLFAYVNGLHTDILIEWLGMYGCVLPLDEKAWKHIHWVIRECKYGTYNRHIWFAYNVHNRCLEYINGERVGELPTWLGTFLTFLDDCSC